MRDRCPNPFCNGYGDIDVSPSINGRAWRLGVCGVGPHPPRDRSAMALYVEGRIRFWLQPDIRLYTRSAPRTMAVALHAEGVWHGDFGGYELEGCHVEVWRELFAEHGRRAAELAAEELYLQIDRSYKSTFAWGRTHV